MNNECMTYRAWLCTRFDAGVDLAPGASDHANECPECAMYRDELSALVNAFTAMPLLVPRNALAQRVKSRLAAEPAYVNDARWWLPAAALCACALLVGATLYFAVPIDPWMWWDYAKQTGTTPQWMLREVSLTQELASAQALWSDASTVMAQFSTPLLWALAAAGAVLLAAVNGAEAYRLRAATHQTIRPSQWR